MNSRSVSGSGHLARFGYLAIQIGIQIGRLTNSVIVNNSRTGDANGGGHKGDKDGRRRFPLWRHISLLTGIVLCMIRGFLAREPAATQYFVADLNQLLHVTLDDGSRLDVQANGVVALENLRDRRRLVLIRGEVLFNIVHDAHRPVDITAGRALVQVLGTQFDVSVERDVTAVVVLDGVVEVSRRDPQGLGIAEGQVATKVYSGERIEIGPDQLQPLTATRINNTEIRSALGWNMQYFPEATIGELVDKLNSYNSEPKLVIQSPSILAVHVGGTFAMSDPYKFAVEVQALVPDLMTLSSSEVQIVLTRRDSNTQ